MDLNSLSGGECYFSYCTGNGKAHYIAKVSTDGENLKDLFEIEADNILNNPMPSVVANRYVYYLSKDGLNCYDLKKEKIQFLFHILNARNICFMMDMCTI